jgi:hypothetical protein
VAAARRPAAGVEKRIPGAITTHFPAATAVSRNIVITAAHPEVGSQWRLFELIMKLSPALNEVNLGFHHVRAT